MNPAVVVCPTEAESGARLDVVIEDRSSVPPVKLDGNAYYGADRSPNLRVSAEGYEPVTVSVDAEQDDCGNAVTQRRDVALQQLGSSQQAIVIESTQEGCCWPCRDSSSPRDASRPPGKSPEILTT